MKTITFLIVMLCWVGSVLAQDSLGIYARVKPAAVIYDDYSLKDDPNFVKALSTRGKVYAAAAERISTQVSSDGKGLPPKFEMDENDARIDTIRKYLPGYHAFIVAAWNKKYTGSSAIPENTPLLLLEFPMNYNNQLPVELKPIHRSFFVLISPASVKKQTAAGYIAFKEDYKRRNPVDYNPPTGSAFKTDGTNEGYFQHKRKMDRYYVTGLSSALVNVDFTMDENFKRKLVEGNGGYSDAAVSTLSLMNESGFYPPGIRTPALRKANGKLAANYNCYLVENLLDNKNIRYDLLWVPYSENLSMPKDMKPVSENGFYLLIKPEETTVIKMPVNKRTVNLNVKE